MEQQRTEVISPGVNRPATPSFSIVIPTFNRASVIGTTIESCLEQTYGDFEVLVVDDGSTDTTENVVKSINDSRVVFLKRANGGPAAARNTGIAAARGRYIAFLDSDDVFLPEKLAACHECIERHDADLYYGPMLVDRGVGRLWVRPDSGMEADEDVFDYLFLRRGVFLVSTIVVRREIAVKNPFNESLWYGDNDQFAVDIWLGGGKLEFIAAPLSVYADGNDQERLSQSPVFQQDLTIHDRFFEWIESLRPKMSERAYLAFRARFHSRITARSAPFAAMGELLNAYRAEALSGRECLRQSIQTFLPGFYRYSANLVARTRGMRQQGVENVRQ
jgi:glycosyltransferase involved in cell wall biosynthesis